MNAIKKVCGTIAGVLFAIISLLGVVALLAAPNDSTDPSFYIIFIILTMISVALSVLCFYYTFRTPKPITNEYENICKQIDNMTELPVIDEPSAVILKPGEICHYQAQAMVLIIKNQVVGHTAGSGGVSVRIAKGLTLHSGSSRGHAIRDDVPYTYPGIFTMTNQRFIMTGEKGFDYPFEKLTSVVHYGLDGVTFQFGRSSYTILQINLPLISKIFELLAHQDTSNAAPKMISTEVSPAPKAKDLVETHAQRVDTDTEIQTPEGAELNYLDAEALRFWNKKHTDFQIPSYYSETAFGRNVGPALLRLLDNGYLKLGDISQRIALKTVPELKAVLADHELKTSGNKNELVQRLLQNLDEDDLKGLFPVNIYQITPKGLSALEPYSILEDNKIHSLGLSTYRLQEAKKANPDEENNAILSRLLSEDIQDCYRNQDKERFQHVMMTTARFMKEIGEVDLSVECYILAFFVLYMSLEEQGFPMNSSQSYYMAKNIEEVGQLCGYSLEKLLSIFHEIIPKNNPFMLGTAENTERIIQVFKSALGMK